MARSVSIQADAEIVRLATSGEISQAAHLMLRQYQAFVYATAYRYLRNREEAEDVAQDVFLKALQKLEGFRGESMLATWLYRITVNASLRALRKKKIRMFIGLDNAAEMPQGRFLQPDDLTSQHAAEALLYEALATLPEKQRETFSLRYFDELSYEEISVMLGTSVGGLKANYHNAVKKISDYFRAGGYNEKLY